MIKDPISKSSSVPNLVDTPPSPSNCAETNFQIFFLPLEKKKPSTFFLLLQKNLFLCLSLRTLVTNGRLVPSNRSKRRKNKGKNNASAAGFEPALPEGNGLAGRRVNHSAKPIVIF